MASKLECKKVGDTLTMHVVKCEVVDSQIMDKKTGQPQEQVKFTDTRGDYLFLPRETADRQLGRCGFADSEMVLYGDVDGHTLIFSRAPNKNPVFAPYWNIEVVAKAEHRPSLKAAAQAEAERVRKAKGLPPDDDGGSMGPHIPGLDDDVPPPDDADSPYDDVDGMPSVKAPPKTSPLTAEQATKEGAINAAYARAYAFVLGVQGPVATPDSLQAGAATLLISYKQAGIV